MFDIHPYDVKVDGETGVNAKQMDIIESKFANKGTLRVAFISDTHLLLADAKDLVADVNSRNVSLFQGQDVSIGDIIGLSIGLKFYNL